MITSMRKFAHSKIYRFFLWVFMFLMAFGGGVAIFNLQDRKDWVIKVYEQMMTDQKFKSIKKSLQQQQELYRQRGMELSSKNATKETLQVCLSSLLAQHAINTLGVQVSQKYLQDQMEKQLMHISPSFIKSDGTVDLTMLQRAIAPNTVQDFIDDITLDTKNRLLYALVDASTYVSNFELQLAFNAEFANKQYSYFALAPSKYVELAKKQAPSDQTLLQFYKTPAIADSLRTVERRAGTVWTFKPVDFVGSISEGEIKAFYDKHKSKRYVVSPAKIQIRRLLIKIDPADENSAKLQIQDLAQTAQNDPNNFASLVQKFSQDTKQAANGGLSEFLSRDDSSLDPVVVEMVFDNLGSDGQISVPLKTSRGYELIQRVKKQSTVYKDLKSVESEIRKELVDEKFKKRFVQDAGRVVNAAKYDSESLNKFVKRYQGVKSELLLEEKASTMPQAHLFKMEQGRYSATVAKDKGYILFCSEVEKSKLPALEDVRSKVLELYFQDQANKLLEQDLKKAVQLATDQGLSVAAEKFQASIQSAEAKNVNGTVEKSGILKDPMIDRQLKMLTYAGALAGLETKNSGVVIQLTNVENANIKDAEQQKEQLLKMLRYVQIHQNKDGFIASLYRTAKLNNKIEIKNELLQNTKEV